MLLALCLGALTWLGSKPVYAVCLYYLFPWLVDTCLQQHIARCVCGRGVAAAICERGRDFYYYDPSIICYKTSGCPLDFLCQGYSWGLTGRWCSSRNRLSPFFWSLELHASHTCPTLIPRWGPAHLAFLRSTIDTPHQIFPSWKTSCSNWDPSPSTLFC